MRKGMTERAKRINMVRDLIAIREKNRAAFNGRGDAVGVRSMDAQIATLKAELATLSEAEFREHMLTPNADPRTDFPNND